MQKNEIRIGTYRIRFFPEETKKQYDLLPLPDKSDLGSAFFHHIRKKAKKESIDFLKSVGVDPEKISLFRPVAEPDEEGMVLYLCSAPICAEVLEGGEEVPRQSAEIAGISVIFVGEKKDFSPQIPILWDEEVEMRFVIPLPFDEAFFKDKE